MDDGTHSGIGPLAACLAEGGAFEAHSSAGPPDGNEQDPEHVVLALEAYPAAAQQGVVSTVYPWSTVVLLTVTFPDGTSGIGSGVMVGRNDVLTAAHVVYDAAHGGVASEVVATPAAIIGPPFVAPYGATSARVTAVDNRFDPDGDRFVYTGNRGPGLAGSELDVAFLTLSTPLGDLTGWMGLDPSFTQGYANLTGYSSAYGYRLTNDTAYAFDDGVDAFTNLYYFEVHFGNSGGPVWHYGPDGRPSVVALVSTGSNGRGPAAFDIATSYDSILTWIASNDQAIA